MLQTQTISTDVFSNILVSNVDYVNNLGFETVKNLIYEYVQSLLMTGAAAAHGIEIDHEFFKHYANVYRIKISQYFVTSDNGDSFYFYHAVLNNKYKGVHTEKFCVNSFIMPLYVLSNNGEVGINMRSRTTIFSKHIERITINERWKFYRAIYPYKTLFPENPRDAKNLSKYEEDFDESILIYD